MFDTSNYDQAAIAAATWQSPEGKLVVCAAYGDGGDPTGFVLYSEDEWNATTAADLEADIDGRVFRLGRPVDLDNPAWLLPVEIREAAL